MELYKPRSFLKLVLAGFAFVALPLIAELLNTAAHVTRLSNQSQHALYRAVQATQNSWRLFDETLDLEYNAAQYAVSGDPAILENYAVTRQRFRATLHHLEALPLTPAQRFELETLDRRERAAFLKLRLSRAPAAQKQAPYAFSGLAALARGILTDSNDLVNREAARVRRTAMTTRRLLLLQALALVPATLVFTALFALLIAGPIKQVGGAIHRLGEGDFTTPVVVHGPRDLEALGAQLDWLRGRLAEIDLEKQKFLHHVSHELKTPLCALREGSELMLVGTLGPMRPEQRDVMQILHRNCLQLQTLIEHLLHFRRDGAEHDGYTAEALAVHDIVRGVLSDHQLPIRKKQLRVSEHIHPVHLSADRQKLTAVIDNLVSNAVKFTQSGGHLEVRLATVGDRVELDVRDDGPGIATEDRARIFEPFYRAQAHRTRTRGSGLGLAIAQEYARAHEGRVLLIPCPQGAHFRLILPHCTGALQRAS